MKVSPTRRPRRSRVEVLESRELLAADVLINEIMYHSPDTSSATEFIEVWNQGDAAVNLANWQLRGAVEFTFPAYELPAQGYAVIAAHADGLQQQHGPLPSLLGNWSGELGDRSETIRLTNAVGGLVDEVTYADEGSWSRRERGPLDQGSQGWIWNNASDGGGSSLELVTSKLGNEWGANWRASTVVGGTPGRINSVWQATSAPLITSVSHTPIVPRSADAVTIRASLVTSDSAATTATLWWRVDGQQTFQTTPLVDDGTGGDDLSQDGIFAGLIPAQPDQAVVEFYVTATGPNALTRFYPDVATVDLRANLLYQVDNSLAAEIDTPTDQPVFRLIMTEAERAELARIGSSSSSAASNAEMNGTFIRHDGTRTDYRYNVGIRNRGKGSRPSPPNNYRVNFPHDRPWNDVVAININARQPAMQILGSELFNRAGIVAGNATPVRVLINGRDLSTNYPTMYGHYNYLEVIDGDFSEARFPQNDDGNLYAARWSSRDQADLRYEGDDPAAYRDRYEKNSNTSEDDWSDFLALVRALNQPPDEQFIPNLSQHVDIEQWLRFLAMDTLLTNRETSLSNGIGDDYDLYRGSVDRRFVLIPHDLDSILGSTDTRTDYDILLPLQTDGLANMFARPEIVRQYYQVLQELIDTHFTPAALADAVHSVWEGWVPPSQLNHVQDFVAQRKASVLAQIPQELTIETTWPQSDGLMTSSDGRVALHGVAPAARTTRVTINGVAANYTAIGGQWQLPAGLLTLAPGLNRLTVEAWGPQGQIVATRAIDVYREPGAVGTWGGTLVANQLLTADRRWQLTSNLVVPAGVTLTVEPGTLVQITAGVNVRIEGQLIATGSAARPIRLTRIGTSAWNGIVFQATQQANTLRYVDLAYSDGAGQSIQVDHARLELDHVNWIGTSRTALEVNHPTVVVTHSHFPNVIDDETIHGQGLVGNEQFILQGNTFGVTTGYSDVIDFTGGLRPGPILQVLDNDFLGGSDDGLDLDGTDAYIAGNRFQNFHKANTSDSSSNAIATGTDSGAASNLTIVRNTFVNVDHALLLKERSSAQFIHNTVVGATIAAINFDEPNRDVAPGLGITVSGSIFWQNAEVFDNFVTDPVYGRPQVTVYDSLLPATWHALGQRNLSGDPGFLAGVVDSFQLRTDSPARRAGPLGVDMGAAVSAAAVVESDFGDVTQRTHVEFRIGGPGVTHYRYRLAEGLLSDEIPVSTPLQFTNLVPGEYHLRVWGRNEVGMWQDLAAPTERHWQVLPPRPQLELSEILVRNSALAHLDRSAGTLELHNVSPIPADFSGVQIVAGQAGDRRFVLPAGTMVGAEGYLLVHLTTAPVAGALVTGFTLDATGDQVQLLEPLDRGGQQLDSISFGHQIGGYSIGRDSKNGVWALNIPTLGNVNRVQKTAPAHQVRISEWFTHGEIRLTDDFIEFTNSGTLPVDLSGLHVSDVPETWPDRYTFPALAFIAADGYLALSADGQASQPTTDLGFKLTSQRGRLALFDSARELLDWVSYLPQTTDLSQGRSPTVLSPYAHYVLPTPGLANPVSQQVVVETKSLISAQANWAYRRGNTAAPANWTSLDFDDSSWLRGAAPLGHEPDPIPLAVATQIPLDSTITYYFRHEFTVDSLDGMTLDWRTLIDDGAAFYLNGQPLGRLNLPTSATHLTLAAPSVGNATWETPFEILPARLRPGRNVLAVELHQSASTSTDLLFALELNATIERSIAAEQTRDERILRDLRITEVMYHPLEGTEQEFIEVQNIGSTILDLTGLRIEGGVDFVFPAVSLRPGRFALIVNDQVSFERRYGAGVQVVGEFTGNLGNQGESLRVMLAEPQSVAVLRFAYDDESVTAWPVSADGLGPSLEVINTAGDYRQGANWRASQRIGGTPGFDQRSGDFNSDQQINAQDIDLLFQQISAGATGSLWDLDSNGTVSVQDSQFLIRHILQTTPGDANLDRQVDIADWRRLVQGFGKPGTWSTGDFDGDGLVSFPDFLLLARNMSPSPNAAPDWRSLLLALHQINTRSKRAFTYIT